jgi:hypothetical protein
MIFSFNLRILAYLRRATRALESISGSLDVIAHVMEDEWNEKHAPKKPRVMEFGSFNQEEANKRWHKEREAAMIEEPE